MQQLTEFQQRAAAAGLHKMLSGDKFYTSTLSQLAELLGRPLGGSDWKAMQPLHCVSWGDMGPELAQQMKEKCLELLGLPPQVIDAIAPERAAEKPSEPAKRLRLAWWR